MTDFNQMSLMELAEKTLQDHPLPLSFIELFQKICDLKGLSEEEKNEIISQVYTDFIMSAKFVYVGDDLWDLKSRQSIDLWDKDGAFYQEFPDYEEEAEAEEDEEVEEDFDDEVEDDEDEVEDEEDDDEDIYEDDIDYDDFDDEEEDFDDEDTEVLPEEEDFDDDKYNEYMDDYEKMYDE